MLKTLFIFTIGTCSTLIVSAQKYKTLLSEDFGTPGTPISTNPAGLISPGTTDYTPKTTNPVNDGQYAVTINPDLVDDFATSGLNHNAWQNAGDHTTGTGYMMIINANTAQTGEFSGSYYIYSTSQLNIPGATYRINFWGANILHYNQVTRPSGNGAGGTYKEAYIGISVRDNANGTGTQYNATINGQPQVTTWILPRAAGDRNNLSWQNLTSAFTLPASAAPAQLVFIFYNADNTGVNSNAGNDLAIDDLLIEMQAVSLSGTVFNDNNANGIIDGSETGVNGTTTPLYVYLTDNTGKIIAKAPVDAGGNYVFDTEVPYATGDIGLKATLSTQNLNIGDPGPVSASTPSGSLVVSENSGGNPAVQTGTPDGIIRFNNTTTGISNLNIGLKSQPLPVVFGAINARILNGILQVNWESLAETDNSHFELEASADGQHFIKIGEVKSRISSGNTSGNTSYEFAIPAGSIALGSIGIFAIGLLGAGFKRRNRNLWILAATAIIVLYACNKKESLVTPESGKLYIRIGQVDKDGTKTYSKIFLAVQESATAYK